MKRKNSRRNRTRRLWAECLEPRHLLAGVLQHGPTALEYSGVGYFLRTDTPQIERYDLSSETWLTPIVLAGASGTPTAELVDADGIYVSFGPAVYRYNADGSGQTHLLNSTDTVSAIHSDGNLLFLNHSSGLYARFISINKTTNTIIDTRDQYVESVYGSSISVETNRILGRSSGISPSDITYVSYDDTGKFTGGGDSPYHGDYPGASRAWVFPGGMKVVDSSGTLYSSDSLTWLKSFGTSITDIGFSGSDIPIVLSGKTLTAYSSAILPTGSVTLTFTPVNVFVNATDAITFTTDTTSATKLRADTVHLSDLKAPTPGQPVNPVGLSYNPDKIEVANDGTVLLFSKSNQSIFRWNPSTQSYGATIPLLGTPSYMAYSGANNTIYLAYASGLIRKIDLGAATLSETPFATLAGGPGGLSTAGQYVFAEDGTGAWATHYTFGPDGTKIDAVDWNYYSTEYVWSDANQKMYFFRDDTSPDDLLWEEINANGTAYPGEVAGGIRNEIDSPLHDSAGFSHPIRVAPDGSIVVLGSGVIHDAKTLARQSYALANSISDAAFLGSELYTVRTIAGATQFQHWARPTYGQDKVLQVSGTADALVAIASNRLLGVSLDVKGIPNFTVLDGNLAPISTSRQLTFALSSGAVAENLPSGTAAGTLAATDSENGHTYSYLLVAGNGDSDNAAFTISGNSLLTAKPFDYEAKSSYNIRVRVMDNAGFVAEQTLTVKVTNVNEAPISANETYTVGQGATLTISAPGVLGNDADADGDKLTAQLVSGPTHGTLNLGADGGFVYTPTTAYNGSDSFTYRPSDSQLLGTAATVSLTVTPAANAPLSHSKSYSLSEDTVKTVAAPGILTNDTDPNGLSLSAVLEVGPAHGSLTLNSDGSFSFSPAANYNGSDKFTYRANNGTYGSAIATITLNIAAVNDPPVGVNDAYMAVQNTTLVVSGKGVLANDTDVDSTTLTAVLGMGPSHGSVTLNSNGSFSYFPETDYAGSDSFTYSPRDSSLTSVSPATVSITVTPAPGSPIAKDDSYTTNEDTTLTIAALGGVLSNDTDAEGDPLSAVVGVKPANGTLTLNSDGSFSYLPNSNYNGTDSFTYRANDGQHNSGLATVTLSITPVNDAPTVTVGIRYGVENTLLSVAAPGVLTNAKDVDHDTLTAVPVSDAKFGSVTLNANGSFSYMPASGFSGTDSFVFRVSDGSSQSDLTTQVIHIEALNDVPVAVDDVFTFTEDFIPDGPGAYVLGNDTDANGDRLTAILVAGAAHGKLVLNPPNYPNGSFTYQPDPNFSGQDAFTYRASDGVATSNIATVTLNVLPVDDPPTAKADSYRTVAGTPLTIGGAGVLANDVDIDTPQLTASLVQTTANGTVTFNADGTFTYVPKDGFVGTDSFVYGVRDRAPLANALYAISEDIQGIGDAAQLFAIAVPSSTASLITTFNQPGPFTQPMGMAFVPDGRLLAYSGFNLEDLNPGTGAVATIGSSSNLGTLEGDLAFNPKDGLLYAAGASFDGIITINPVTGARKLVGEAGSAGRDISGLAFNGTGVLYGIAMMDQQPDMLVSIDTATGVATPIGPTGTNGSRGVAGLAFDPGSGTLYLSVDTNLYTVDPATGAATLVGNIGLAGAPANSSAGFMSGLSFPLSEPQSTATVTIEVSAFNRPPVAHNDQVSAREDGSLEIPVSALLGNDTDADADPLSMLLDVNGAPAHGSLTIQPGGQTLVYTPAPNFNGDDYFTYFANDGKASSARATVSVAVAAVNDAPSFTAGANQQVTDLSGDQSIAGWATHISAGPANEAGQQVHFVVLSNSNQGLFEVQPAIDARGTLTFTPLEKVTGLAQISLALMDDGGSALGGSDVSEAQTFTIQVDWDGPWHNRSIAADVTGDGEVAADDALDIINRINAAGSGPLASHGSAAGIAGLAATNGEATVNYYDVTGDNYLAADDVMAVINFINAHPTNQPSAPEGEATSDLLLLLAADVAGQGRPKK
jgi:VCBS repeat-containing protein